MKLSEFFNKLSNKKELIMTIKTNKVDFYVNKIHYAIQCSTFVGRENKISIRKMGKLTRSPEAMVCIEIGNLEDNRYYVDFENGYEDLFYSLDYERIYNNFIADLSFRLANVEEKLKELDKELKCQEKEGE